MYFWNKTLQVSDSPYVHHKEFFTVHTAMIYVIQVCWHQAVSKPVWHTPLLCVQWKNPYDGQGNWTKHVEFYSKTKFEKLVHLVGFIIRILLISLKEYKNRFETSNLSYFWHEYIPSERKVFHNCFKNGPLQLCLVPMFLKYFEVQMYKRGNIISFLVVINFDLK